MCIAFAAAVSLCAPASGHELTTKVYGATLEPGVTEVELRYGRLSGGPADGADGVLFEAAHHFSRRFYAGIETQWSRELRTERRLDGVAVESILTLGRIAGVDAAILGEVAAHPDGPESAETKLLFEKRGKLDARLNLKAEKTLAHGQPVEFGYAASLDMPVIGDLSAGLVAVGELGTSKHLTTHGEHFVGPVAKFDVERLPGKGELGVEAGYLFAIGDAHAETRGQLRLLVEYEFRF